MHRLFQFSLLAILAMVGAVALWLLVPNAKWVIAGVLVLSLMLLVRPLLHLAIVKTFTTPPNNDDR